MTAQEIEVIHGHLIELERDASQLPFTEFAPANLKVQTKSGAIIPLILKPVQLDLVAKLTGRDLVVKPRQVGLSTTIQAMQFQRVAYTPYRAAALAHDSNTTSMMRAMHSIFYSYLPEHMKPERAQNNASTITYLPHHGRVTLTTAGSPDAGIGTTYNEVHGTEVARWKNAEQIVSGLVQGVPMGGRIIFESTPYGARGWFYEHCMEALHDPKCPWALHFYPWWWEVEYTLPFVDGEDIGQLEPEEKHLMELHNLTPEQINWRRAKVRDLPFTFKQEYPESIYDCFLSDGNSAFGDFDHCLMSEDEMKALEYDETHRYMAGVDWGQESDFTALSIIDATENREIYIGRWNRMPWDEMQNRIVDACIKWHVETIQPERNSMGSVNIENLRKKFLAKDFDLTVRRFTMTNDKKQKLVGNFHNGIHNAGLKLLNDKEVTSELRTFVSKQLESGLYKFEHMDGAHDDTVIARMLAWDAVCRMI